MEAFPDNTDKKKEATATPPTEPEKEFVPDPTVRKRKQTFGDKAKNLLVKEDAKSVWSYVFGDILIPALKNTFVSMVQNGVDLWVNGRVSPRSGRKDDRVRRTAYSSYYDQREDQDYRGRYEQPRRVMPTDLYDELEFESIGKADYVLSRLRGMIYEKGFVSIAEYYRLAEYKSDYTAVDWGWLNLDSAKVIRSSYGYILKLPRPVEL